MRPKSIALTGLPQSGIDRIAAALAERLGRPLAVFGSILESSAPARDSWIAAVEAEELVRPEARAHLRSVATVVWIDQVDGQTAEPSPGSESLRRRYLGPLTVTADHIVVVEPQANGLGRGDESVEQAADLVHQALGRIVADRVVERVELVDGRSYPVVVGRGVLGELSQHLPPRSQRVAVVTQEGIGIDVETDRDQQVFVVPDGEEAKNLGEVGRLTSAFAQWGMTRADCVVALGGGVVTDLAGFAAASYHRGIPVVHVPTTLLGQIDAAIGGKCGVNLPEGKNLVGAFWQPTAVVCDVDTLDSLPGREFTSGMGELAKYHFLGGGRLDRCQLVERVARSVAIKADVVSGDEREGGRRAILNYGHTLAHVLENMTDYSQIRHGEAVAVGLIYAAELAMALGRIDADRVAEHRRVVEAYGLDPTMPAGLDHDRIVELFARDKKAIDGITFVLDGPDGVETVAVDDRPLLAKTLESVT